jgi:hypothetical protein
MGSHCYVQLIEATEVDGHSDGNVRQQNHSSFTIANSRYSQGQVSSLFEFSYVPEFLEASNRPSRTGIQVHRPSKVSTQTKINPCPE